MLVRRIRLMHAKVKEDPRVAGIDPGDLGLILERLCREPGSDRRFFLRPRANGGYAF